MPRNQMDLGWRFAARANAKPAVEKRGRRGETMEDRFWEKVEKRGPDECWPWIASRTTQGYGQMKRKNNTRELAHRLCWQIHNGPIPKGMWILHKCDNPWCVNPNHLKLGTPSENTQDMVRRGRTQSRKLRALTDEQAREVRRLYAGPVPSLYKLAVMFKLSHMTIRSIVKRKTYADVI